MPELSSEQQRQIIQRLTDPSHGWVDDPLGLGRCIVIETLDCSAEDATRILKTLCDLKVIEMVSEPGGVLTDAPMKPSWRWISISK
jgi:hypothetical protein